MVRTFSMACLAGRRISGQSRQSHRQALLPAASGRSIRGPGWCRAGARCSVGLNPRRSVQPSQATPTDRADADSPGPSPQDGRPAAGTPGCETADDEQGERALAFAQFEREVTSERIRDKIAASKRKGLWVGGMVPLGYDSNERRITVSEAEAERVRRIFRGYLKLGSLNLLMADLRQQGIVTKVRTLKTGATVGGIPFTRGPLAHLLRNRFYIGEVPFKGEVLDGEQPSILDRDLFDAVQAKLSEQTTNHRTTRMNSEALLTGRIFDDRGNRMSPSHVRKRGRKYRYYLSSALFHGAAERAGSVRRVPAADIEALVIRSVREHLKPSQEIDDRSLVHTHVARVEVQPEQLIIQLAQTQRSDRQKVGSNAALQVAWQKTISRRRRAILVPDGMSPQQARPIRSENRATLVASIARGRRWLEELIAAETATTDSIAKRERCSVRKVNMTISLAFLAPDLVKAAIDGRLPHGMGVARLADLPAEWSRQHQTLGLAAQ